MALLIALGLALPAVIRGEHLSASNSGLVFVMGLMLPLFPLHGVYVLALTRLPGYLAMWLAVLLPVAGFYGLTGLFPDPAQIPPEFLKAGDVVRVEISGLGVLENPVIEEPLG